MHGFPFGGYFWRAILAAAALALSAVFIFPQGPFVRPVRAQSYMATTSVIISVCGDGNPNEYGKVCDDGTNTGAYSTTTAGRHCAPGCQSWGPYCGDGVLQSYYGEQCDLGSLNGVTGSGCSATCEITSVAPLPGPAPAGGGGGSYNPGSNNPPTQTQVIIRGHAYPGANVNILEDGATIGIVQADSGANFYFSTTNVSPGVVTFGFWAQDSNGFKSVALTTTFTVTEGAVTTVSGIDLPPTVSVSSQQVAQGAPLTVYGQSVPAVTVTSYVHSSGNIEISTTTDANGNWSVPIDTSQLQNDELHTVDAEFTATSTSGGVERSTLSQQVSFFVGSGSAGNKVFVDLDHDGKVDLTDFSILLYYWGTNYPPAEFDHASTVDLGDFSIMLYYWTG